MVRNDSHLLVWNQNIREKLVFILSNLFNTVSLTHFINWQSHILSLILFILRDAILFVFICIFVILFLIFILRSVSLLFFIWRFHDGSELRHYEIRHEQFTFDLLFLGWKLRATLFCWTLLDSQLVIRFKVRRMRCLVVVQSATSQLMAQKLRFPLEVASNRLCHSDLVYFQIKGLNLEKVVSS